MTDKMELLKRTKLFVLDMDGTFYLGNQILSGAADFLKAVEKAGKQYLFFTNNSSRSPRDYMEKLEKMGCPITRDQIMTSGDVTIRYLQTHYPDKTVYLVGTPPLVESFQEAGIPLVNEKPDIVVIGFDTTLTYEKLSNTSWNGRAVTSGMGRHFSLPIWISTAPPRLALSRTAAAFVPPSAFPPASSPSTWGSPLPKPWRWCWTRPALPPRKWPLWATACIQMWLPA